MNSIVPWHEQGLINGSSEEQDPDKHSRHITSDCSGSDFIDTLACSSSFCSPISIFTIRSFARPSLMISYFPIFNPSFDSDFTTIQTRSKLPFWLASFSVNLLSN
jgi:hypothetical protein